MKIRTRVAALLVPGCLSACCLTPAGNPDAGAVGGFCRIESKVIANRAANPSDPSECCNALLNPGAWSRRFVDGGLFNTAVGPNGSGIAVVAGDFNGDGLSDLAVLPVWGNQVYVFINRASTFVAAAPYRVAESTSDIAVVDLNRDGFDDLVTNNATAAGTDAKLSVLMNRGDGTFEPPVTYASINNGFHAIVVGDFNGDHLPDVVVAWGLFFAGTGDGRFRAAVNTDTGKNGAITAGDFNGDGKLDLAVANWEDPSPGTIAVSLGQGNGSFLASNDYASPSIYDYDLAAGDFDGDGLVDLAVQSQGLPGATDQGVTFLRGVGNGTFGSPTWVPLRNGYPADLTSGLTSVDLAGDGRRELLISAANFIGQVTFADDGGGEIGPMLSGSYMYRPAVGDFNGDRAQDLAAFTVTGSLAIYLNGCP